MRWSVCCVMAMACGGASGTGASTNAARPVGSADSNVRVGHPGQGTEYVLVASDAVLYAAPDPVAIQISGRKFITDKAVGHTKGQLYVFVRGATRGAWQQVRSVGKLGNAHCAADTYFQLEQLDLELWVKREHVAPVLARSLAMTFADGTGIDLEAGTPLARDGRDGAMAILGHYAVPISPPDEAVGIAYRAAPPRAERVTDQFVTRDAQLRVNGQLVRSLWSEADGLASLEVVSQDERFATVRGPCGQLRAAKSGDIAQNTADGEALILGKLARQGPFAVKAGATAYWADGRVAGRTAATAHFDEEDTSVEGDRPCVRRRLRRMLDDGQDVDPRNYLTLCFNADDIDER